MRECVCFFSHPMCVAVQVHRCRQSISFSLQCAWLLGAYSSDMHISTQRHSRGTKLRKLILSDELKPAGSRVRREPLSLTPFCPVSGPPAGTGPIGGAGDHGLSPSKRTHQRSKSDATVSISLSSNLKRTASNPKVESSADEVSHRSQLPCNTVLCLREALGSVQSSKGEENFNSMLEQWKRNLTTFSFCSCSVTFWPPDSSISSCPVSSVLQHLKYLTD